MELWDEFHEPGAAGVRLDHLAPGARPDDARRFLGRADLSGRADGAWHFDSGQPRPWLAAAERLGDDVPLHARTVQRSTVSIPSRIWQIRRRSRTVECNCVSSAARHPMTSGGSPDGLFNSATASRHPQIGPQVFDRGGLSSRARSACRGPFASCFLRSHAKREKVREMGLLTPQVGKEHGGAGLKFMEHALLERRAGPHAARDTSSSTARLPMPAIWKSCRSSARPSKRRRGSSRSSPARFAVASR